MRLHSVRYEAVAVICAAVLFANLSSTKEMVMVKEPDAASTRATVDKFNDAFNRHDADGVAALLTDDTVFEDTSPAPDGKRVDGKAAVAEFWRGWFARNVDAHFDAEDVIVKRESRDCAVGLSKDAKRSALASARCRRLHGSWREGRR